MSRTQKPWSALKFIDKPVGSWGIYSVSMYSSSVSQMFMGHLSHLQFLELFSHLPTHFEAILTPQILQGQTSCLPSAIDPSQ
jgi:hypothetical protein